MAKFEKPSKFTVEEFLAEFEENFWKEHTLLDTKYHIQLSSYSNYDSEYGTSTWVPAKDLYGPYDTAEEAQKDIDTLNADPNLKPEQGTLKVRTARLVERTVVKRFWI
jgi:hypothetical protein